MLRYGAGVHNESPWSDVSRTDQRAERAASTARCSRIDTQALEKLLKRDHLLWLFNDSSFNLSAAANFPGLERKRRPSSRTTQSSSHEFSSSVTIYRDLSEWTVIFDLQVWQVAQ